ncbi:MAG: glmZ(sRNA)-inactivating NTPase [Firmicutes bacterium ADurb.Bin182]|nr:MAG: glmZ(sRNA)-inactivating NTPase [Firmicutes bacterium ADurb.Bin182]
MYLLIVTGLSGAGKSQALRNLEDMGFFCVDNMPGEMAGSFVQLCMRTVPPIDKAALVIDSRESVFRQDTEKTLHALDGLDVKYEVLFLDCRDDVLEMRYNETRRMHPMGHDIREAIRIERELLMALRERANYIVDTSKLKPVELTRVLQGTLVESGAHPFILICSSFGYKRGVPFEADIVLDMRFSPNPFYEPSLRHLSGLDKPVRDFVLSDPNVVMFLDDVTRMLHKLIPRFKEQGKHRLMVAFGCTGGRHRSVCAASEVYSRVKGVYHTKLIHRDLCSEAEDINQRFNGNGAD